MRWITVMALLALWPGNGLAAQQAGVGSKVRWQETGGWVEGRLEEAIVRGGPLLVRIEGGRGLMGDQRARRGTVERVGLDAERLEWQRRPGRRNQGALIGASVAAALGVAIGLADGDDPPEAWFGYTAGEKATLTAALLAPVGVLVGARIAPGAQWGPVGAGDATRMSLYLGSGGVGVRVGF